MGYPFKPLDLRAQCLEVHDGDTGTFLVDRGNYEYAKVHIRILGMNGVGFDAFELKDKDLEKRKKAIAGRDTLKKWLAPMGIKDVAKLDDWPLRIVTHKEDTEDSFGRWLAEVYFMDGKTEKNAGDELLKLGLGVPWKK